MEKIELLLVGNVETKATHYRVNFYDLSTGEKYSRSLVKTALTGF